MTRLLLAALGTAFLITGVRADDRPDLLFIVADDLRFDAVGFAGNPVVQTPNLDQLRARGVRFENAFVTTSICCVSRASLLSGQHARRHGIVDFATSFSPEAWAQTYPGRLRAAGYRTGFIGKYGIGNDGAEPHDAFDYWDAAAGQGKYYAAPGDVGSVPHLSERQGGSALKFLDTIDADRPFCLSVSFKAPHAQDGAAREFWPDPRDEALYAGATLTPTPLMTEQAFQALPPFLQSSEARTRALRRFVPIARWQETTRDYYRLVTGLDREVGRILRKVEQKGRAGRTVVIFTSDNGFYLGDRGLSDKWFMHEESIRVPLVICDPRRPPSQEARITAPVLNIDLAPTLLDYAGIPAPSTMQGRSLRPWVEGRTVAEWRTQFFYEHRFTAGGKIPVTEGVRASRWTYTRYPSETMDGRVPEELFDRITDPLQLVNRAADPAASATVAEMRTQCDRLAGDAR